MFAVRLVSVILFAYAVLDWNDSASLTNERNTTALVVCIAIWGLTAFTVARKTRKHDRASKVGVLLFTLLSVALVFTVVSPDMFRLGWLVLITVTSAAGLLYDPWVIDRYISVTTFFRKFRWSKSAPSMEEINTPSVALVPAESTTESTSFIGGFQGC